MTDFHHPRDLRAACRTGDFTGNTSGLAPGYVQCNIVILPADWANDFLQFCRSNPKPCPLIASAQAPGSTALPPLGDIDIRGDLPSYRVFRDGALDTECGDIASLWREDLVTFALGCSFSFEEALIAEGLDVRNVSEGVNVPMYRTNIACEPAGPFGGNMVVSMRPFSPADATRAAQISGRYPSVHGAPVHQGNPELIGIENLDQPDFGDPIALREGELPVFWACGVTPQVALEEARPPLAITHSPGCMLVTDLRNSELSTS